LYELVERYTQVSEVSEEALERESIATDSLSFQDSVEVLAQYSLVNNTRETSNFSIHAIVHDWSLYHIVNDQTREHPTAQSFRPLTDSAKTPPVR
jgi:hypothetical protein